MEAYLGGEEVAPGQAVGRLRQGHGRRHASIPVLFTAAKNDVGVRQLVDAIAKYFPSPADVPGPACPQRRGGRRRPRSRSPATRPSRSSARRSRSPPTRSSASWPGSASFRAPCSADTIYHLRRRQEGRQDRPPVQGPGQGHAGGQEGGRRRHHRPGQGRGDQRRRRAARRRRRRCSAPCPPVPARRCTRWPSRPRAAATSRRSPRRSRQPGRGRPHLRRHPRRADRTRPSSAASATCTCGSC